MFVSSASKRDAVNFLASDSGSIARGRKIEPGYQTYAHALDIAALIPMTMMTNDVLMKMTYWEDVI